jgi:hypothetical protein
MTPHVYHIMDVLVQHSKLFQRAEEELMEPPIGMFVSLNKIEADLASSAHHFHAWFATLQDLIASSEQPLLPRYVVREVASIDRMIQARLKAWGWEFVLGTDGLSMVHEKLDIHRNTKYHTYLDAVLSSRPALDLPRNRTADDEADRAVMLGIKATMTPEEGERLRQGLLDDWFYSPALTSEKPRITIEEHDELVRSVDIMNAYFRHMIPPDEKFESDGGNEVEPPQTSDASAKCNDQSEAPDSRSEDSKADTQKTKTRRKKKGRPPDTDAKEDRRIAQAWKTGTYSSLEDLAQALGKKKEEVKRALDRHRHRDRKKGSG